MSEEQVVYSDDQTAVVFRYRNWKGETDTRRVVPRGLWFVPTEWHPEPQWILKAFDLNERSERDFAVKDITGWRPA